jgi:uncharacterized alkaline shock family protein YloU
MSVSTNNAYGKISISDLAIAKVASHTAMESYGIVVAEVCKANDLPYYYGKNTIAYTSCVLF